MIDERFSSENFVQKGKDTDAARELADLLAQVVLEELDAIVHKKVEAIIADLNAMGHNLSVHGSIAPGCFAYRDESGSGSDYECWLRLAADTFVTTGYSHLINLEDIDDDEFSF